MSASWCLRDETNDAAQAILDRLVEEEAVVPALWPIEMANVLVVAERRNRITPADAARAVELLLALPIRVEPGDMASLRACRAVAREYALSSYDSCYLEAAQRLGLPLATLDHNLIRAARQSGVPLLCG